MADALITLVLKNLNTILEGEVRSLAAMAGELKKLSSSFTAIQALIADAETRQIENRSVRDWLQKLKDVAYDVDDVLDDWTTLHLTSESHATKDDKVRAFSSSPFLFFNQFRSRHKISNRIQAIRERLDWIGDEKNKYQFSEVRRLETNDRRKTTSFVDISDIQGRSEDQDMVMTKLICQEGAGEGSGIGVISVVGIGGIGKTTLAQLIYNDERVKTHFTKRMWVCLSEDFSVTDVTKKIMEDATGNPCHLSELNTLQTRLVETLQDELFLLVLDDVWHGDETEWERLRLPLKCGRHGSKILVTTRSEKAAKAMDTNYIHNLKALSPNDCWLVFSRRAFAGREREECIELEDIGRQIVEKCKGVPLSAKTIGSVMQRKRTAEDWECVLKNEIWAILEEAEKGILPALLLSYYNLPVHLKQCFAYCSVFPKDHWIQKDMLVQLWMAQGFISSEKGREMEEVGAEYFDDLLWHSLFQDVESDNEGNIIQCKLHDLVHDLAQYIAESECCTADPGKVKPSSIKYRHSSLSFFHGPFHNLKSLRTLLLLGWSRIQTIPPKLFDHVKFLRALDLSGSHVRRVPSSIGKLKHLRYLNLSKTAVEELPESVGSLCNLQTLKLNQCTSLRTLPRGTSKLISLRHLEIEETKELKHTPEGIGRLSSLRTLCKFFVQDEGGCNIGELGNLNLLNGSLEIKNLERVASEDKARKAELKKKRHLQTLILHCDEKTEDDWRMIDNDEGRRMEGVFKGLRLPHTRVKQLIISNYTGSMFPSWTEGSSFFTRLVDVGLFDCRKLKQLPTLGKLPSLKYLNIEGNDEVERLGCEFIGNGVEAFPKLEKLTLSSFSKLEEWKLQLEDGHTVMPRLLQLTIEHCPKLKLLPPLGKLPCLEFLEIIVNQAMEKVGAELYGSGNSSCSVKGVAFPKLEKLLFYSLSNWEVWDFRENDEDNIMPCLLELSIERCPKLKSVPGHVPNTLRKLTIAYCDEVIWRPLPCHPTPRLEELVLKGQIGELPPLPNLKVLKIIDTANLSSVHENVWEQLELLHTLCIWDCHQLTTLPAQLGKIVSLQTLHINQCTQLKSLPDNLGQLESLQTLYIIYCPQLKSLTDGLKELKSLCALHIIRCEELQSLPHWLGQLESLHTLHIRYCSQLRSLPDGLAQLKSRHHSPHNECYIERYTPLSPPHK
eukprot:TRINITY_DN22852_c2_g2_i1.p1 TRINITY_DN22852_c2_g2~~TRINITY_DN22852_c2_g2_i1.p1  ORF type:complete len:1175 (-),score=204.71 TRINITY_DN22852_c2_g2_i1:431-3955(-)